LKSDVNSVGFHLETRVGIITQYAHSFGAGAWLSPRTSAAATATRWVGVVFKKGSRLCTSLGDQPRDGLLNTGAEPPAARSRGRSVVGRT